MDNRNENQYHQEFESKRQQFEQPRFSNSDRMDNRRDNETYVREERTDRSYSPGQNNQEFSYDSRRSTNASSADSLLDQDLEDQRNREKEVFGEHYWEKNNQPAMTPTVVRNEVKPASPDVYLPPKMAEFDAETRRENPAYQVEQVKPVEPEVYLPPKMAEFEAGKTETKTEVRSDSRPIISQATSSTQPMRTRPAIHYLRDVVLWRDLRISAPIFLAGIGILAALSYFSFISVFAYTSFAILVCATAFVLGRQIMFHLQKRTGPHPFHTYIQNDVVISPEWVHNQVDNLLYPINKSLTKLRNVYLVESLVESAKIMLAMYLLTYVGAWFNLMTVMISGWVMAFVLPKVYMMYRPQINRVFMQARGAVKQGMNKVTGMANAQKDRIQAQREKTEVKREVKTTITEARKEK